MLFGFSGRYIICDGAMGTMLQTRGLRQGERSDIMNMTSPESVEDIHRMYVEAGSNIIYTNTFGANSDALRDTGYTASEIIASAVNSAKKAVGAETLIALDLGPAGSLLEPMGSLKPDRAYMLFREQATLGEDAGVDLAAIETMSDINELKSAVLAIKENTDLPIIATMSFDNTGHTYIGCTPEELVTVAEEYGISAIGLNCSLAPSQMHETVLRFAKATKLPLVLKPNAGLPEGTQGKYSIDPGEFAIQMKQLVDLVHEVDTLSPVSNGINSVRPLIIGGCCGTSPSYISEIRRVFQ